MTRIKTKPRHNQGKQVAARIDDAPPPEQQPPVFSLRYLDRKYCLSACTKDEKAGFADTLHHLSQMSWRQIGQAPRKGLGYEQISRDALRAAIPPHVTEDVNFIAFRFFGNATMVGYRDRATFYVIWLDRNFDLYDHS